MDVPSDRDRNSLRSQCFRTLGLPARSPRR